MIYLLSSLIISVQLIIFFCSHSVGCSQIMNVVKLMNIFENSKNENTKLLLFTHFELDLFRE